MKKIILSTFCMLLGYCLLAQTRQLTGVVKDVTNNSVIAAATVTVKGKPISTVTNADGNFSLNVPTGKITLEVSSIGFATKSFDVNENQNNVSFDLSTSTKQLTEVVVTALGIKKEKRALGYSTTDVDGSKFTQSRELNVGNALTGQVAGVNVAGVASGPGGSSRIVIRGNATLGVNNQPLYVVDGVPYDNSNQGNSGQWGGQDFGDGLSSLNPDDIETVQVLKGVAATALYGYRGGNGAILITTKSGTKTKGVGVEINNNLTFNQVNDEREYQYVYGQGTNKVKPTTMQDALDNSTSSWGAKLDGSQAVNFLGDSYAYSAAPDNFKNFYQTGVTNQTSIGLTGSNDKGHFRLGISNMYMKTVIPNSDLKQQGINFNSSYNVTSKFQVGLNINYTLEQVKNRASFSDAPGSVIAGPLYLANSFDIRWLEPRVKPTGAELLPGSDIYFNNPYFVAYNYQNKTARNRLTGGLTLKYDLTKDLSIQGQVTRDQYIFDLTSVTPTGTGYLPGGNLTQNKVDFHETNGNFMITYDKTFGDFGVKVNAGGNSQDNVWSIGGINGAGPFQVPYFYTPSNISSKPFTYDYKHYRVNSLYASADLSFKDYLYLSITGRNDWYSTLSLDNNNYLYPSVSLSYVFSEMFKMPEFISFGKFRASYAQSSKGADPYKNLLTYGLQGYTISSQPLGTITQTSIPNSQLEPVKIKEIELGLNMQFLDNRLGFDFAYYNKKTTDDILPVTISPTTGYTGNTVNIGQMRNEGIELLLTGVPIKTKDFNWRASFNIAVNNNEVLALSEGAKDIVVDGAYPRWGNSVSIKQVVGLPFAQISGYAYKRNESGQIVYGADGMPLRSDAPVPLGSGVYKTTGGFSNDLSYKNFTFSFLFDFKYGAKIYSGTNLLLYNDGLHENTLAGREGGYVGPGVTADNKPNTKAVDSRLYFQALSTGASFVAEEFVYDASFIKLRSASLSYTIPASVFKGGFVKGLSLSLIGRNLATLVKHTPNIDPESNLNGTNGQGLELSGYPAIRSYGFNVNFKF